MKKTHVLTVILTVATLTLGFATNAEAAFRWPWQHRAADPAVVVHETIAQISGTTPSPDPVAAETKPVDLIVRAVLTQTFVDHANKGLAMAGTGDPMYTQCVQFGLTLRQELIDKPLVSVQKPALATVDLACPLCVLEAKRQDLEMIQSGALAANVAAVRLRVRDIKKRYHMACGPLVMDETDLAGNAFDALGGLLGR